MRDALMRMLKDTYVPVLEAEISESAQLEILRLRNQIQILQGRINLKDQKLQRAAKLVAQYKRESSRRTYQMNAVLESLREMKEYLVARTPVDGCPEKVRRMIAKAVIFCCMWGWKESNDAEVQGNPEEV